MGMSVMRFVFSSRILGRLSLFPIAFLGLLLWIVRTGRKEVSAADRKYMQGQISQGCVEVTNTVVAIANQLEEISPRPDRPKIAIFCDRDSWERQRNAIGSAQSLDTSYLVDVPNGSILFNAQGFEPLNEVVRGRSCGRWLNSRSDQTTQSGLRHSLLAGRMNSRVQVT
jgi:hypothetical protein